jgi:dihydrofolate synthase/folylpolyglutamate synthase
MLRLLSPWASRRIYTAPRGRAPAPPEALAALAPGEVVPDPRAALARALEAIPPPGLIVVAGSIYLAGDLRADLLGLPMDPVVAL